MRTPSFLGAVFTAISSALTAQTFIVDAANGPGAHFTDLPPAVAAAPDGAILLVRPGDYGCIQLVGKGLSILATAPGVVITQPGPYPPPNVQVSISVSNLAPHQTVTLRGLSEGTAWIDPRCLLRDCAGQILVDDWTAQAAIGIHSRFPQAVVVERCQHVTLRNCHLRAHEALRAVDSDVVVENSDLIGHDPHFLMLGTFPGTGAVLVRSSVTFSRCRVRGGDGEVLGWPFIANPQPAISASDSQVRLCEDGSSSYTAGQRPLIATPAITGSNSTVVRDPSAVVNGSNGAPAVAAVLTDIQRPLPSLRTVGAPPGGTVLAEVTTPIGELVLLAVSLPGPVTTVPGIDGSLRLDPGTAVMQALGVPAAGVPMTHSMAVPNNPALSGARFAWQALAWSALYGLRASNPSIYAH